MLFLKTSSLLDCIFFFSRVYQFTALYLDTKADFSCYIVLYICAGKLVTLSDKFMIVQSLVLTDLHDHKQKVSALSCRTEWRKAGLWGEKIFY